MPESRSVDVELLACEMPGCTHVIEYAGVGRKPKYCNRVVDGVMHSRLTAQKVRNGTLTLPSPGSRPNRGDGAPDSAPRPVSLARAGIEAVRDEIASQLASHQSWMTGATARLEELLSAATDPDAAATEVAAAHREARARIDAAEAATEDALNRARAAESDAGVAALSRAEAEQVAETALTERDEFSEARELLERQLLDRRREIGDLHTRVEDLGRARDEAAGERDRVIDDLGVATAELDRLSAELEEARTARDEQSAALQQAEAERDARREELTALRYEAGEQRRRAETAEYDRDAARRAGAELRDELTQARARAEQHAADVAEARTAQAVTAAENTSLARQLEHDIDQERRHGEQRLADLRERHAEELRTLRGESRNPTQGVPDGTASPPAPASATASSRRRGAHDKSPNVRRTRRGAEQTSDDVQE